MIENKALDAHIKAERFFQKVISRFSPKTREELGLKDVVSRQNLTVLENLIPMDVTDLAKKLGQHFEPDDVLHLLGCTKDIGRTQNIGDVVHAIPTQETITKLAGCFDGEIPGFFFDWYFQKLQIRYHSALSGMQLTITSTPLSGDASTIINKIGELKKAQLEMGTLDPSGEPYVAPILGYDLYDLSVMFTKWWFLY